MTRWSVGIMAALLGLAIALVAAPAGVAKDGDVLVRGTCTGASTSKLKLSDEDGRIEVEFEVDQNRNGVRWNVTLFQNGRRIARMTRVTRGPSGSFEARIVAPNRAGTDAFRARATRSSGEACTARASFA
ncbi:MAG: hypothetical protein ACRDPZ_08025 [Gaiellaceae bacterium]